jgi:hypothetical protein
MYVSTRRRFYMQANVTNRCEFCIRVLGKTNRGILRDRDSRARNNKAGSSLKTLLAWSLVLAIQTWFPASSPAGSTSFDVRAFGARGDGSSDDSRAIQKAINALRSHAGTVYFPPGDYKIMSGLAISGSGVKFVSSGGQGTIIRGASNFTMLTITGSNVTVQGLTLDGQASAFPSSTDDDIDILSPASNVTIADNVIKDASYSDIGLNGTGGAVNYIAIHGNRLTGFKAFGIYGVNGDSNGTIQNVIVSENFVDGSSGSTTGGSEGVVFHTGNSNSSRVVIKNITISSNYLTGAVAQSSNPTTGFCVEVGSFVEPPSPPAASTFPTNVFITGNVCLVGSTSSFGGYSLGNTSEADIHGNLFNGEGQVSQIGIEVAGSHHAAVTGNEINGGTKLWKGITVDQSSGCIISGNLINGFATPPPSAHNTPSAAIHISTGSAIPGENVSDNFISQNHITFPSGTVAGNMWGIWLQCSVRSLDCSGNSIIGNTIFGSTLADAVGIEIENDAGTVDRTTVGYNFIRDISTAISRDAGAGAAITNTQFVGNTFGPSVAAPYAGSGAATTGEVKKDRR